MLLGIKSDSDSDHLSDRNSIPRSLFRNLVSTLAKEPVSTLLDGSFEEKAVDERPFGQPPTKINRMSILIGMQFLLTVR